MLIFARIRRQLQDHFLFVVHANTASDPNGPVALWLSWGVRIDVSKMDMEARRTDRNPPCSFELQAREQVVKQIRLHYFLLKPTSSPWPNVVPLCAQPASDPALCTPHQSTSPQRKRFCFDQRSVRSREA